MSKKYTLTAEIRAGAGKGIARAVRRENKIPAVIYGDHKEPVSITLPGKETMLEYRRGRMFTNLCEIVIDGKTHLTLARDIQFHPVTDVIEHVDFLRVTPKTRIKVGVPLHFVNEELCPGLKAGGVLNVVHHEIEMECAATDIPSSIEVDLSGVALAGVVRLESINLPKGATPVLELNETVATIAVTRAAVEAAEAAAAPAEAPKK